MEENYFRGVSLLSQVISSQGLNERAHWVEIPRVGGYLAMFWVDICRPGFQIWKPFLKLVVKCKSEENCAVDDKSTIFGIEIIDILKNIFWYRAIPD